jgi:hypothetical protein
LFVHYDQALDGSGLRRLAEALACRVDFEFPREALKRSPDGGDVPRRAWRIYRELCRRAHYAGDR